MAAPLQILLADDDADDRFFFTMELNVFPIRTTLIMVEDGEKLMTYLSSVKKLPEVLFLDLNMPRIHGAECLAEIKKNEKLKNLPVVIHSTSCADQEAKKLYDLGAHYFCRKTDSAELHQLLEFLLPLIQTKKLERPKRDNFVLSFKKSVAFK
ncbi:MAG: rcp1 2 [Bacteroidetes bacterium]|jgi:CheY-like chemotaxis protein|nr:rcp1 2 [Bacteroidota bacterium]